MPAAMATLLRYLLTAIALCLTLVFVGWVIAIGLVSAGYPEVRHVEPAIHLVSQFAAADWFRVISAGFAGLAGGMWLQWLLTPRPRKKRTVSGELKRALGVLSKNLDDLYAEGVVVRNALRTRGENLLDYEEFYNDRAALLTWIRKAEDYLDNDMLPKAELAQFRHPENGGISFDVEIDQQASYTVMVWDERLKRLRGIINRIETGELRTKTQTAR
jgi:hypothetical protein